MFCAYILQSESTSRYYIGSTNDLDRRLSEHVRGHGLATRGRGPWKVVYTEPCESLRKAQHRKLEIKRWKSAKLIEALIQRAVG
jgi:putative endonuclease